MLINVLPDENVLLRDASEVSIIELEKLVKPNVWDSSQKLRNANQHSSPLYSQPNTKSKEWKNYLDLVYRVTSTQPVRPTTLKSYLPRNISATNFSSSITCKYQQICFTTTSSVADNFDITLLTILQQNICGLPVPETGWDVIPLGDTSKFADILRITISRNEAYSHIIRAQLDDGKFNTLWQEILQSLIRLGIFQNDIDEIKMAFFQFCWQQEDQEEQNV